MHILNGNPGFPQQAALQEEGFAAQQFGSISEE